MTPPLRGGLIGCGFVAQHHLRAWSLQPRARLAAVCDTRPERLEWARSLAPAAAPYADAAAMLEHERLDFVEICTRPDAHRPLTELAARHGAHVLCQKPVADSRADLLAMIEACDRAGVRLMVHENWRFRPWYRALKHHLDGGLIGEPIRLRLAHRETRALRPDGFADQPYFHAMPRLIAFEMGPHLVDVARFLLGEARSVLASLARFGPGHPGDDVATLIVRHESNAISLLDMSWCAPAQTARPGWALNETVLEGTTGALELQTDGQLRHLDHFGRSRIVPVRLPADELVYLDGYRATQEHFINGLLDDAPHETSARDVLRSMEVIWAAYEAAEA